ncbi:MAG TPA: NAD(P)-dependent oxidoreductase, partial [Acidimicrobiia bacterium]|nr:NAD(P)-dependent oxidoreductase [Acidimicrobiia bacterium]
MNAAEPDPTTGYPVSLSLGGRRVLVVGAGRVATRRVADLLGAGARVDVVSPAVSAEIEEWAADGRLAVARRPFEADDVIGAWLCVAATDDRAVNHSVVVSAERAQCFVSAAGDGPA